MFEIGQKVEVATHWNTISMQSQWCDAEIVRRMPPMYERFIRPDCYEVQFSDGNRNIFVAGQIRKLK